MNELSNRDDTLSLSWTGTTSHIVTKYKFVRVVDLMGELLFWPRH